MAKLPLLSHTSNNTTKSPICLCLLLLAITIGCATSARILDELDAPPPVPAVAPVEPNPVTTPVANVAPVVGPTAAEPSGGHGDAVVATSSTTVAKPVGGGADAAGSATVANADHSHPPLSFFMHDILGGSTPSGRVVTGIVANTGVNGQLPFSRPNGGIFPGVNGGVPLLNGNNGNNNNLPYLAGLGGTTRATTVIQNNGNNNVVNGGNTLPFVSSGELPAGATLQKLIFGSITVIDDELTEGHELGSSVLGKAQGFYLASSLDGSSQTMAVTALFHGGGGDHHDVEDTLSFFGVHRTAAPESQIAIVGGTGKYENAKGYATIQTHHQADQHTTDGVETLLQFDVYLTGHH